MMKCRYSLHCVLPRNYSRYLVLTVTEKREGRRHFHRKNHVKVGVFTFENDVSKPRHLQYNEDTRDLLDFNGIYYKPEIEKHNPGFNEYSYLHCFSNFVLFSCKEWKVN